jgi:hypothetical protein
MEDIFKNIQYHSSPFPILCGTLPVDLYKTIQDSWPIFDHSSDYCRLNISITDNKILTMFDDIVCKGYNIFQQHIPNFTKSFSKERMRIQYAENPLSITQPLKIRGWHLDNGTKEMVGLWYFRDDYDESVGGNLLLLNPETNEKLEIDYKENYFVLFPNTITSWHAVTPRKFGVTPRKFINIKVNNFSEKMHCYGDDSLEESLFIHNETSIDDHVFLRYNLLKN